MLYDFNTMALTSYSAERISNTALVYRSQISKSSQLIYVVAVATILIVLVALPFVKIPISINGTGVLQSTIEKTELIVPVNGRLIQYRLSDNKRLKQGDTLLAIDAGLPKQQDALVETRKNQITHFLQDISTLLSFNGGSSNLQSGQYVASWQQYVQELKNAGIAKRQAASNFARYSKLYQNKVLTQSEYEKYKYELEQAESVNGAYQI
jgi:HlyD family secretion protein